MYHFSYAHTYVSLIFQTNEIQPEIFTSPMPEATRWANLSPETETATPSSSEKQELYYPNYNPEN